MIKEYLEDLKGYDELRNFVIDHYINESYNYDSIDDLLKDLEELQQYGCQSGMISELIYYNDTLKFYEDYKDEINDLLVDVIDNTGCNLEELFGDKYDKEDPLNINYSNQNLFAWFGFEESAYRLYEQIYEKQKNNAFEFSLEGT